MIDLSEFKAAIYARKSILNDNNSIEAQISYGKDKLFKDKLTLYEVYRDEISATEKHFSDRPAFSKLLKDAKEGKFKNIVVFRRDRLARNVDEFKEMQFLFKQHGIKILYSNPGEYAYDENSFSSGFIENLIIAMDELEAKVIKERTGTGIIKKRERREYGSGANPPLGYTLISDTKDNDIDCARDTTAEYIPEESKANFIRYLFQKYTKISTAGSNGISYTKKDFLSDVIKKIDANSSLKIPTDKLSMSKLEYYIKRPIYCGYMYKNSKTKLEDILIKDESGNFNINMDMLQQCINVKPIIFLHQWIEAIIHWRNNHHRAKSTQKPYLFHGLLYCNCGSKLNIQRNKKYPEKDDFICKICKTRIKTSFLTNLLLDKILDNLNPNKIKEAIEDRIDDKIKIRKIDLIKIKQNIFLKSKEQNAIIRRLVKDNNQETLLLDTLSKLINDEEKITKYKIEKENSIYQYEDSIKVLKTVSLTDILSIGKNYFIDKPDDGQVILEQLINKISITIGKRTHSIPSIDYGKDSNEGSGWVYWNIWKKIKSQHTSEFLLRNKRRMAIHLIHKK